MDECVSWLPKFQCRLRALRTVKYGKSYFLCKPLSRLKVYRKVDKKVPVKTKAKLRNATEQHMDNLAQNPERIRRFFQDKWGKYAA